MRKLSKGTVTKEEMACKGPGSQNNNNKANSQSPEIQLMQSFSVVACPGKVMLKIQGCNLRLQLLNPQFRS